MRRLLSQILVVVMAIAVALPLGAQVNKGVLKRSVKPPTGAKANVSAKLSTRSANAKAMKFAQSKASAMKGTAGLLSMKNLAGSAIKRNFSLKSPRRVADSTPLLGMIVYNDDENFATGVYNIPTDGTTNYTLISEGVLGSAGVLVDGKYYVVELLSFWGMYLPYTYVYDAETWELLSSGSPEDFSPIALDMAYDATTGKVYGCFYNADASGYVFGSLDLNTFVTTPIRELTESWFGVAVDKAGVVYAINKAGDLFTVDKATGATTLVGNTGLATQYLTSAAIDQKTGRFYYAPNTDTFSGLYEIDPATAEASLIAEYPGGDEFQGLCVPAAAADDAAPASVENLKAEFDGASLSGNIVFDTPLTTFDGTTTLGELTYTVTANGETIATGQTAYAQTGVTVPVTVSAAGKYEFAVTVANSVGNSPRTSVTLWVGDDVPKPVSNVSLVYEGGKMKLTWDAITESVNGGFFDPSAVTYTVVRYPGEVVVASNIAETSFSEDIAESEALVSYYYTVAATYNGVNTSATASNTVALGSIIPPYLNDFSDEATSLDGYTLLNLNNDGKNWTVVEGEARMGYNSNYDMDAWLITPALNLEAGKLYTISFDAHSNSSYFPERVEAFIGTTPTVAGMTERIVDKTDLASDIPVTFKKDFVAETAGSYYVGIHGCSDADMYNLYVDNIAISEGSSTLAPAAVADFTITPDANGALTAKVEFTTPSKTISGADLATLTKVELSRDGNIIKTYESPAPGETLLYDDNDVTNGTHVYSVVAYNEEGRGLETEKSTYVGVNVPAAPASASVVETANPGEVTISWEPVTSDVDGNPINQALVKYSILDKDGNTVAENLTGTSYTYQAVVADSEQSFVYYGVFASTEAGLNADDYAVTDMIPVGQAYSLPVAESFADGAINNNYIWGTSAPAGSYGSWSLYTDADGIPAQDGDNGFAGCSGYYANDAAALFSGKIAIADEANPALTFYYYTFNEGGNTLDVQVNSGNGFETVQSYVAGPTELGWVKAIVPLSAYKGKNIQIGFYATIITHASVVIDNIKVVDLLENNLSAVGITVPKKMNVGEESTITVNVENSGIKDADNYTVELYRNGSLVQTQAGTAIASGNVATVEFKETPTVASDETLEYYAVVKYDADQDDSDNTTDKAVATVVMPKYPAVSDLNGEKTANGAVLTWSEPDLENISADPVTEDFESYESYALNSAGNWSFVDADGANTYGINGIEFPNTGSAMAYILFDGSDPALGASFAGHSGNKYLATFASIDARNDDWAISPELDGSAQTVSFFAKTYYDEYGSESFEFYYSTTGKDLSDFVKLGGDDAVPTDWTEYSYEVPEGTKYFAIRCTSNDCFIFLVDDVTFIPADAVAGELALVGYNVYRDGEKITAEPVAETTFTDSDMLPGEHTYFVTVVYDKGESKASNSVIIDTTTGIKEAAAKSTRVASANRTIIVSGAEGLNVTICTADGKTVYSGVGTEITRVRVNGGVYIVKVGKDITKTVVK